jgi:hypothetical protein
MFGLRQRHVIGLLAGAALGLVVAGLGGVSSGDGLFWGAVIGGILAGVPQFAQSGAVLTGSENRAWNTLVGIVGGLLFLGVITALAIFLARLFF